MDESRVGAGAGRAHGCTEVDSKALSCSQMVAKAVTRFQVDQTALELDKVVGSFPAIGQATWVQIQTLANIRSGRSNQDGVF